jgi:hypothetical protein
VVVWAPLDTLDALTMLSFSLRFVCDVNDDVPTIMDSGEQLVVVVLILPRQPVLVTTLKPVHWMSPGSVDTVSLGGLRGR